MKTKLEIYDERQRRRPETVLGDLLINSRLFDQAKRFLIFRDKQTIQIERLLKWHGFKPTVVTPEKRKVNIGDSATCLNGEKIMILSCARSRHSGFFIRSRPHGKLIQALGDEGVISDETIIVAVASEAGPSEHLPARGWSRIEPDYFLSPSLGVVPKEGFDGHQQPDWSKIKLRADRESVENAGHSNIQKDRGINHL